MKNGYKGYNPLSDNVDDNFDDTYFSKSTKLSGYNHNDSRFYDVNSLPHVEKDKL